MALVSSTITVGYRGGNHKTRVSLSGSITVEKHHLINLAAPDIVKMLGSAVYDVCYSALHPKPYAAAAEC